MGFHDRDDVVLPPQVASILCLACFGIMLRSLACWFLSHLIHLALHLNLHHLPNHLYHFWNHRNDSLVGSLALLSWWIPQWNLHDLQLQWFTCTKISSLGSSSCLLAHGSLALSCRLVHMQKQCPCSSFFHNRCPCLA